MQYAGASSKPAAAAAATADNHHNDDDDDDVMREVMSADEVTSLLQQVISQDDHQLDLFTCRHSATAAAERDLLDKLKTASNDDDADNSDSTDTRQREFVLRSQQVAACSSLPANSSHASLTVVRGQNVLLFGSQPSDHYFCSVCWFVCVSVCLFVCLCRVFLSRL